MRNNRAYTMMELLVAMAMALVVLTALIRVFWFGRKVEREARSAYLITEDADIAFRKIQEDLRLTNLSSIWASNDGQGFSMVSPLENNDRASFSLTDYGTAKWKTWVHYTLKNSADGDLTGDLVRWEAPYTGGRSPAPSDFAPAGVADHKKWSLLTGVTYPGVVTEPNADGFITPVKGQERINSGLQLHFVRREEGKTVLSTTNPAEKSDADSPGWSKGCTELVDCRLRVADKSTESGRWSVYTLNFRVKPRN